MIGAEMVLTDSGGIQEESTMLQIPCLTLRENTERPVTISEGTNRLVGIDKAQIITAVEETICCGIGQPRIPEMWDGKAGERIIDLICRFSRSHSDREMIRQKMPCKTREGMSYFA
jgi:UDP-N-acetylglucosamine 2-epimerase (non-hydrolysing)